MVENWDWDQKRARLHFMVPGPDHINQIILDMCDMYQKVYPYHIIGEILGSPKIHVTTHYFKDWNIK